MANHQFPKWKCSTSDDPGDEVVISGIAGRFPNSNNVKEFAENLYNKNIMITTNHSRYDTNQPYTPPAIGMINNIAKFDALFFGISSKQADMMDPMSKFLLEHTFEALLDAGINPQSLRGKQTGVFIGVCFSNAETVLDMDIDNTGLALIGCCRSGLANRISFFFDIHGPSISVDTACSSSLTALDMAYRAIKIGECDSAIVAGCNMCNNLIITQMFYNLGVLTMGTTCHCFDYRADGYIRSEAVGVLVLQKAKDAKRIYARVVHTRSNNDGYKEYGITYPSSDKQFQLFKEMYGECGVSPDDISFLEAHSTGTKVGDPQELIAIDNFFGASRKKPLKIGSVKSNIGHSEGASGICSVVKALLAMETGLIPPNVNFEKPPENCESMLKGRLQVITEPTPLEEGYIGINSYGFGGSNVHLILKANPKEKRVKQPEENNLPILVFASGRTEEAVASFLDDVENRPVDAEYIRLLHDIFAENINGHLYRGYTITPFEKSGSPVRTINKYDGEARPIWFIFSGMGSQWPGMGTSLMRFPVFVQAILKCDSVLKPRGLDILDILTNTDKHNFDNILRSFVGITAIQIGLVDILTAVGIVPDQIIGHSLGELACGYADGCFTAEEAVLAAYSRGMASIETELINGSMAAVGLGYNQIKDMCPSDIEVACHNSPESSTISGPKKSMEIFIAELQAKGVFAREVPTSNIAYHSKYIAPAGNRLLNYLRNIINEPKPRSEKWLSTSVPRSEWSSPTWKLSSAEYYTNNLLSPVLFEETAELIPKNAITIEISPYGLLQTILNRSLDPSVFNVALTKRGHKDNAGVLLEALGKLYNVGVQPQLTKLYPVVEFPVSRGTPMISPLVKWEHSDTWSYVRDREELKGTIVKLTTVNFSSQFGKLMIGHVIDGRHLVPATAYLTHVWEIYRAQTQTKHDYVIFENVMFHRATIIPPKRIVELSVLIEKSTGQFCIKESNEDIVTGTIHISPTAPQERIPAEYLPKVNDMPEEMNTKDVYKELRLRGYQYSGTFRGIKSSTVTGIKGHVAWNNNWISFMDTIMQMQILRYDFRELVLPTRISEFVIDLQKHEKALEEATDATLPVIYYESLRTAVCGGVQMRGLTAVAVPRRTPSGIPVLEEYKFVEHRDLSEVTLVEAIVLSVHLALENSSSLNVQTVEFDDERDNTKIDALFSAIIVDVLRNVPMIRSKSLLISSSDQFQPNEEENPLPTGIDIVTSKEIPQDTKTLIAVGRDLLSPNRVENLKLLIPLIENGGFLVSFQSGNYTDQYAQSFEFDIIMEKRVTTEQSPLKRMVLLKKRTSSLGKIVTICLNNNEFSWIEDVKEILKDQEKYDSTEKARVVLVGEGFENGLLGFLNCLRKEPGGQMFRGILIQDANAPKFSLDDPFYRDQLQLDLAVNVLQRKVWGSYRHLPLSPLEPKLVSYAGVDQKIRGDFKSFRWSELSLENSGIKDNFAYVYYTSLNFRDVMIASAKLQLDEKSIILSGAGALGFEFSGIDQAGNRVTGLTAFRSFANLCCTDEILTFKIPDEWTLEEAATVPCAYATCYYAFYVVGQLQRGQKILIHAGSGAVGQAAIRLALHEKCEVFTTVGTPEKREFIKKTFPAIDDDHIGNSRDTSFELMVLKQTDGRGVDIVLNSLTDEKLQASLRCLAENGTFLEIGKFDIIMNKKLGMSAFSDGINFRPVALDMLCGRRRNEVYYKIGQSVHKLVSNGINKGIVKPLTRTVFDKDEVENAFRYMAAGKHIGKVMIKIRNEEEPLDQPILAYPGYYSKKDAVYVIFGGLGGIGLELTDWLILRGATKLVLVSRTGVKNGYQRRRIRLWESKGVKVLVVAEKDVSNKNDVESILKEAKKLGPVDGIFNLAVVLNDALCTNQTKEFFQESFKAKATLAKILDELTRKMCPDLRHFVMFSSGSCGKGNVGQSNYAMSNSVMERICEKRMQDGLPGLALQWGAVGDVGVVADMQVDGKELVIAGTLQQGIKSCLEILNDFLQRERAVVSSMVVAEKMARESTQNVVEAIQSIMGIKDLKRINMHTPLPELGVDSMTVVEIKETLEREYDIFITPDQIRTMTFGKLLQMSGNAAKNKAAEKDKAMDNFEMINQEYLLKMIHNRELYLEVCVELPTKVEANRSRIYLIPGIQGNHSIFKKLSAHIKSPATCLQLDLSVDRKRHESIVETANSLLPYILSSNTGRKDIFIVAYSFGTLLAIEIARKIEFMGLLPRLILIDGSPYQLKSLYSAALTDDEAENQTQFITMSLNQFYPISNQPFEMVLQKCTTWKEKKQFILTSFKATKIGESVSAELAEEVYDICYRRLVAVRNYDISNERPLKSPIILLRQTENDKPVLEKDYGLSKVTEGTVNVHYVEGNHLTILDNLKIAEIINDETIDNTAT